MQSLPIITKDVSSNPAHGEMHLIQYYVIVCQRLAAGWWFSPDTRFTPSIKLTATIYLSVRFIVLVNVARPQTHGATLGVPVAERESPIDGGCQVIIRHT